MSDPFSPELSALENKLEKKCNEAPIMPFHKCWSLFHYIEHGDEEHREWLARAIISWSLGLPKPKVV